jgi:cyclic lactone autoinducer peptide
MNQNQMGGGKRMKKRSIIEKLLMAFAFIVCELTSFLILYEPEMPEELIKK